MLPPPPRSSKQHEASADPEGHLTDNDMMLWLEPHAAGHAGDASLMELQYGSFSSSSSSSGSHLDLHKMGAEAADAPAAELPPHLRPNAPAEAGT